MQQLELSFSAAVTVIILLFLASGGIAYLYYRRTLPPVPRGRRMILATIRGLALFLLSLLLFDPLLSIVRTSSDPPVLAVLIDNSRSMGLTDAGGSREESLRSALEALRQVSLPAGGEMLYYRFGGTLHDGTTEQPDSITLSEESTDISRALKDLRREEESKNLRAVVLLSDGSSNSGENPVYDAASLGLPLYTVGIGDSSLPMDLVVSKVLSNDLVYENTLVPVDATIRATGFADRSVEVSLEGDGKTLDRKQVRLLAGSHDYGVSLSYSPEGEGVRRYRVHVTELAGELTHRNNAMDFFARVIKGKLRVLIVASGPSPDLAVIKGTLGEQPQFFLTTRTERLRDGYYEGPLSPPVVDSADCLLLIGMPDQNMSEADLRTLSAAIDRERKPVFFVAGKTTDAVRLRDLSSFLGISASPSGRREELAFLQPAPEAAGNPLLSPLPGTADVWSRLPPVFRTTLSVRPRPEAVVLARPRVQGTVLDEPLLVARDVNQRKSVSLLAYGIWRWKMMTAGDQEIGDLLPSFLTTCLRWLTARDDNRPLKVSTTKEFFTQGEEVGFTAQLYDQTASPVSDADMKVVVARGDRTLEVSLIPAGNGRYEGGIHGLEAGEYTFSASAVSAKREAGRDSGRFSVGEVNLEFLDTRMDADLLRRLSTTTGGKFLKPADLDSIADFLGGSPSFTARVSEERSAVELWHWTYTLILAVALFALEWFLRKRSGMV